MKQLHVISGGAAQGLVARLEPRLQSEQDCSVVGSFGAVGMMKDKLLAGAACDVVILTEALIQELAGQGHVDGTTARPLGVVRTGVAVKTGQPAPAITSAADLSALLRGSSGIYFPDPVKATAGIHFMKVLVALGLDQKLAARLRPFPNGATAMQEMARSDATDVVGCTQVTEILITAGVDLVGVLPKEFELATVYTAAVSTRAQQPSAASALIGMLSDEQGRPLRVASGFELVA